MRRDALAWEELLCNEERCPGMRTRGRVVPLPALASQKCRAVPTWAPGWSPCPVLCSHPTLPVVPASGPCQHAKSPGKDTRACHEICWHLATCLQAEISIQAPLVAVCFLLCSQQPLPCAVAAAALRGGAQTKVWRWLSPGGAGGTPPVLPLLPGLTGRAGTDLGRVSSAFPAGSRQPVDGSAREGAAHGKFSAGIALTAPFGSALGISHS